MTDARSRIALAADLPLLDALSLYDAVAPYVGVAKVGLSLFVEHGPRAVEAFQAKGARVFLDLKLHDIPNTVELAAARAGALGVGYLTVHAAGGRAMLESAVKGAKDGAAKAGHAPPVILAVTVLTSMDDAALAEVGVPVAADAQAARLAALAKASGAGGLVCSAREVAKVRAAVGPAFVLCTPGIRPAGAATGDQARVETPAAAIAAGADLLVVGRPIYAAASPRDAAKAILDEISA
ncbi:MAG: orotidine-5'-phosphate decarboxylase [Myxococcota bacterium]|jgi:orotidine-5'-phosphate decarboxylase